MAEVIVFQTGFRVDDSLLQPGDIFRKADDSLWEVLPDNTQAPLGSGGSSPYLINVKFTTGGILIPITALVPNTLVGGASFGGIPAGAGATSVPEAVTPAFTVVAGTDVSLDVSGVIPETNHRLDAQINVRVTDPTGENTASMSISTHLSAPVTDTAMTLNLTGGTWSIDAGTDLVDAGDGNLTTTDGGVFSVFAWAKVKWD